MNKLKSTKSFLSNEMNKNDLIPQDPDYLPFKKTKQIVIRGKTLMISEKSFEHVKLSSTKKIKKLFRKKTQFQVPLNQFNKPHLIHLIPFYNRISQFNFSLIYVDEEIESQIEINRLETSSKSVFLGIESENRMIDTNSLKKYDNELTSQSNKISDLKGINKDKISFYYPDSNGFFKCLNSNQKIPYSNLNDDFCDCLDGTDEPGTSACQFSIFYCTTQNEYLKENYIPSSRVDDKICDCCDGSDESALLNCKNTCDEKLAIVKQDVNNKKQGLNLKRKYLVEGVFKNEQLYGPQGVFFKLSKSCFNIEWSEYIYDVCPFQKVLQHKHNKKNQGTSLGVKPSLVSAETQAGKIWILKMEEGDSNLCGFKRKSEIYLSCGIEDKLIKVEESQKCEYKFELNTPAAC